MALWLVEQQLPVFLSEMARQCLLLVPMLYRDTLHLLHLLKGHEREAPNNGENGSHGDPAQIYRWQLQYQRRCNVERAVNEAIQSLTKITDILKTYEQQKQRREEEQEQQIKKKKKLPRINIVISKTDTDALETMKPQLWEQHKAVVAEMRHLTSYFIPEQVPSVNFDVFELPADVPAHLLAGTSAQVQVPPRSSRPSRPMSSASIDNVSLLQSFFGGTPSPRLSSERSTTSISAAETSALLAAPEPSGLAALSDDQSGTGLRSVRSQLSLRSLQSLHHGVSTPVSLHEEVVESPDTGTSPEGISTLISNVQIKLSVILSSERGVVSELEAPVRQ